MANHKNLASVVLEYGGTTSQSSIVMSDSDAAIFPSTPFYATIMPSGELANNTNSEIIEVTASSSSSGNTTFTVSRAQRGTSAISWSAGEAIMVNGIYVEDAIFEGATLSTPSNVAYVAEANIQSNAVTTSKIADGSVTSDKIDWTTSAITFNAQTSNITLRPDDFKATKFGTQCVLEIRFMTATTFSSNGAFTLGTVSALPSGTAQLGFGYLGSGANQYPLIVFAETNGAVKCRVQSPNASIASPAFGGIRIQYESTS